ncbi:MAG: hypothetical protein RL662_43 [Bacteroidota bacterium]|jgi:hypothetical protein
MSNIPKTIKSRVISIDDFEIIKQQDMSFEGFVKDKQGNYFYVISKPSYWTIPNKSKTESSIVQTFNYIILPLQPKGIGGWVWRSKKKHLFFDRNISSQEEVSQKYGGFVSYLPESSRVDVKDDEGYIIESFRVFLGEDRHGYVIDQDGIRLPNDVTFVTSGGTTIFATSEHSLDPSTLYQNYFWTSYVGPNNPRTYGDEDSFHFAPESFVEWSGYKHDKEYNKLGAKGIEGAILNGFTLGADVKLVLRGAASIPQGIIQPSSDDPRERFRDGVVGGGIVIVFGAISIFKAIKLPLYDAPRKKVLDEIYEKHYKSSIDQRSTTPITGVRFQY